VTISPLKGIDLRYTLLGKRNSLRALFQGLTISQRLILFITLSVILHIALLGYFIERNLYLGISQIVTRQAKEKSLNIATITATYLVISDYASLETYLKEVLNGSSVMRVQVHNREGRLIADSVAQQANSGLQRVKAEDLQKGDLKVIEETYKGYILTRLPASDRAIGWVTVYYGTEMVDKVRQETIEYIVGIGLVMTLSATLIIIGLMYKPVRELSKLSTFAANLPSLKGGQIGIKTTMPELRRLADSINYASVELSNSELTLKQYTKELQQRVLKEVEKQRQQEQILIHQSRMAAMGEMIGAIAHQWRQPLNAVGLIVQDIKDAYEYGELDRQYLDRQVNQAMALIKRMSKTIDDFRNFFRPDKERQSFDLKGVFGTVLGILSPQLMARGIQWCLTCKTHQKTFTEAEDILICGEHVVYGYKNELEHCMVNIINNARDALEESRPKRPMITIEVDREGDKVIALIRDNAGGIPEEIIGRVFDPYFTTKEEGKGTGIGLYMAKMIIERNMGGRITVRNTDEGAEFRLELPSN
jgi:signal transduction histidine kinase